MKTLLLILLTTTGFLQSFSQDLILNESGQNISTGIISDSLTKEQNFTKVNEWVMLTYNSGKDVLQSADKENGRIICKGVIDCSASMSMRTVNYTLLIDIKENKVRYKFSNFVVNNAAAGIMTLPLEDEKVWKKEKLMDKLNTNLNGIVASLTKYLSSPDKSDW